MKGREKEEEVVEERRGEWRDEGERKRGKGCRGEGRGGKKGREKEEKVVEERGGQVGRGEKKRKRL